MDEQLRVLSQPFDIDTHKKTFKDYLEVILLEDGTIVYATPSHQEKLIALACKKLGMTREELSDFCPREYYADFMTWLCSLTGSVALWDAHIVGRANERQQQTIARLVEEKLYKGPSMFHRQPNEKVPHDKESSIF